MEMSELKGMEDWGLHAVVRGCNSPNFIDNRPISCFGHLDDHTHDLLFNFPNLFDTTSNVLADDLGDVYKPFYPILDPIIYSPEIITPPSISALEEEKKTVEIKVQGKEKRPLSESNDIAIASTTHAATKNKRRRNQQKRVVLQVTAENLSSDPWAWRKYGQKPIKGSPYPRSYYRCSSSKGCLARKQVEKSCSDTGMFIITYTSEHSHTQPTRRNSLAGTTRQKFPTQKSPTSSDDITNIQKPQESNTSSPRSTAEEFPQGIVIKQEDEEQVIEMSCQSNEIISPDFVLSENFFVGLEDLDELISDYAFDCHFTEQFR